MIFEKNSTRTRVSFEAGMFQLGGHALFLSGKESQIGRGEPIQDTARAATSIPIFRPPTIRELAMLLPSPM